MATTPPPGWYDDPDGEGDRRWWDGTKWTDQQTGDAHAVAPSDVDPQAEMDSTAWLGTGAANAPYTPTAPTGSHTIKQSRKNAYALAAILIMVVFVVPTLLFNIWFFLFTYDGSFNAANAVVLLFFLFPIVAAGVAVGLFIWSRRARR